MTYCNEREARIVALLRESRCTMSARDIAAALHSNSRAVRADIGCLRAVQHVPIASTSTRSETAGPGFWFPRSRADVERTIAQIRSRIVEEEATILGLEIGADDVFGTGTGQMTLGLRGAA